MALALNQSTEKSQVEKHRAQERRAALDGRKRNLQDSWRDIGSDAVVRRCGKISLLLKVWHQASYLLSSTLVQILARSCPVQVRA
ncbi:unnamed protein product [Ectocarpus sp. CCAP 1310/34]|nr:unnamed protein product [Ectocarpus sp. CCAP 1310/34]